MLLLTCLLIFMLEEQVAGRAGALANNSASRVVRPKLEGAIYASSLISRARVR